VPGYRNPADFDPGVETIDTDAWADAAKSAGMKYGVLTAKHTGGFCLWDSKYTTYDIMHPNCPYNKDVVVQFINSFKSRGLKVGLYYLWRNPKIDDNPKTSGLICLPPECDPRTHRVEEQMEFHKKQIAELLEKYPDLFYIWHDGLDPTIGPADEVLSTFKKIRPDVIHSANWWDKQKKGWPYTDIAVTENFHFHEENSFPGETCWMLENSWFWKAKARTRNAEEMVQHIRTANSRKANFLLNTGPGPDGKLVSSSVKALAEIGRMLADSENKPE
jgi:alpha-L-fucosidase